MSQGCCCVDTTLSTPRFGGGTVLKVDTVSVQGSRWRCCCFKVGYSECPRVCMEALLSERPRVCMEVLLSERPRVCMEVLLSECPGFVWKHC